MYNLKIKADITRWLLSALLFFVCANLSATPSGEDLLRACTESLNNGFSSDAGMMCTWYVTPCDCFHADESEIPRVCLPTVPDIDQLARDVTQQLKAEPELLGKTADVAAGQILEKKYPCTD